MNVDVMLYDRNIIQYNDVRGATEKFQKKKLLRIEL